MDDTIMVGIEVNHRVIDLKIPTQVTVGRLQILLQEALGLLGINLPNEIELILKNKSFELRPDIFLADYPLGDGDQFLIVYSQSTNV